jgi:hypothetical protein
MPLNPSPKLTAAERRAALIAERDALAAHLETVKAKRDSLPPSDPGWRRANAEMRDVADELDGYAAAISALAPEVETETREAHHAARVAQHARAMEAADLADAMVAAADRHLSAACRMVRAYMAWVPDCAAAGGVEPHPYRLGETVPDVQHFRDVFLARLVAAGILDTEFMPQHIVDAPAAFNDARIAGATWPGQAPPDPMQMAASASFAAIHAGFKRALASAAPDRQRREVEHLNEMARQRAARDAEAATRPLPKLPAPPPAVVHAPARVIGR